MKIGFQRTGSYIKKVYNIQYIRRNRLYFSFSIVSIGTIVIIKD